MKNFKNTKQKGFTLIETLVATAIFVLVGGAVAIFSKDVFVLSGTVNSSLSAQQDARNILRKFVTEVRTASISNTGAYALANATADRFKFYSDTDADGLKEEIHYYLTSDGKQLKKDVLKPTGSPVQYTGASTTSILINNMKNGATPIFEYYDKNYDGSTAPLSLPLDILQVRLIKITIIVENDPNRSPVPLTATSQAMMRNLKDNL